MRHLIPLLIVFTIWIGYGVWLYFRTRRSFDLHNPFRARHKCAAPGHIRTVQSVRKN